MEMKQMMDQKHRITTHSSIEESEYGEVELEFGFNIKYEHLMQMGTGQLYDEIFDRVNALIKEACTREAANRRLDP